mgnify:CR=1 FL=1
MAKKFAFIGAGSFVFTRNIVRDLLTFDAFRDCDRGEAAGLGTGDAPSVRAESEFHRHLRQLYQ